MGGTPRAKRVGSKEERSERRKEGGREEGRGKREMNRQRWKGMKRE